MSISSVGFSLWCDFVERQFLEAGFQNYIKNGYILGATSNPAIFQKAFAGESYREDIAANQGKSAKEIYESLAIRDIRRAAEILQPLYDKSLDGFISIEVDPHLCDDAQGTVNEGKRLFASIGMPNVMIKVPATEAGFSAMEELTAAGIHVNATLIFGLNQATLCLNAFEKGIARCQSASPQTVLSVFVSRFDRKCDSQLDELGLEKGKLGIRNAERIYHTICERSIPGTRTLFASTGVKGDEYPPAYYVDELLFENCVNTAPIDTIDAYLKNPKTEAKTPTSKEDLHRYFDELSSQGFDLITVENELMREGLEAFKKAFDQILTMQTIQDAAH